MQLCTVLQLLAQARCLHFFSCIMDNQNGQLNSKMELLRMFAFVIAIGTDQYCKLIYWALMRF